MLKTRNETVKKAVIVALAWAVAAPALAQTQLASDPDAQRRRSHILLMEGLLARAGSNAAENFSRRLQQIDPSMTVFMGQTRARGFVLEGYGIFFEVEVPQLIATAVWSQIMVQRDNEIGSALATLKRALQDMPEGPSRQQAQQAMRMLYAQAGPVQNQSASALPDTAIKVSEGTLTDAPQSAAEPSPLQQLLAMKDPRREYRDTVERELIDAMLDYSFPMNIAAEEWLSVAALVADAGQRGQILMLRIKGSDLALYAADRSRRDEVKGRVEVRVY